MGDMILIVEDDPSIALGLEKNLAYEGYEVLRAADGETGLELAIDRARYPRTAWITPSLVYWSLERRAG